MRAFSTLRILPRIGRIAWMRGSRPWRAEPPAESPSTMKTSHSSGWSTGSPTACRAAAAAEQALAVAGQVARLAGRDPGRAAACALRTMSLPSVGFCSSHAPSWSLTPLHEALGLGVAELGLGLALELRLGELEAR
jgi:hypothetical protein